MAPTVALPAGSRFLVMAPNSWWSPWVNRQQLFSRLGRLYPVLYTTGPWPRQQVGTPEWWRVPVGGGFVAADHVLVDLPPRFLLRLPRLPGADRFLTGAAVRRWRRRLARHGGGPLIAYVYHPKFWPLVRALKADHVVYHAFDLFRKYRGWNPQLAAWQRSLLANANLAIGSSSVIVDELAGEGGRDVRWLPNAVDFDAFARTGADPAGEAPDLAAIPRPRIGYTGTLNAKVDYELIAELAARRPSWQFVLIGGVRTALMDDCALAGYRAARERPNVHFLGSKPHSELPAYVAEMDVNVMCYRVDDRVWTEGIYPLKLHEYLAAGRPVVSADLPSVRPFGRVVEIASGVAEWQAALASALEGGGAGSIEERQALARANTWDRRVCELERWLIEMVHSNSAS